MTLEIHETTHMLKFIPYFRNVKSKRNFIHLHLNGAKSIVYEDLWASIDDFMVLQ